AGFAQTLGLDLQRGSLTENERLLAEQLMLEKYGNPAWNKERGKRS
ncbi:MAG TPA: octanoyltransferase, partial [Firmicutes bacterium]|nr:octanoyltransferase [Bacillota bacterium]HCM18974.1 octanoyltransferase [Bacillota bacterium]